MKTPYLSPTEGLPGDDRDPPVPDPGLVPEPEPLDIPLAGERLSSTEVEQLMTRAVREGRNMVELYREMYE